MGVGVCRPLAVLHVIRPSRGKAVVQALFGTIQPMVWVSDMLGSQRGHGVEWQVCLAHLLRDARYAVECGDVAFSVVFKRLLLRAIAIGRRRDTLKDTTLKQYHADLDRRLDRIMAAVPSPGSSPGTEPGATSAQAHRRQPGPSVRVRYQSLRALHQPCVRAEPASQCVFRKVTNGFAASEAPKPTPPYAPSLVPQRSTTLRSLQSSSSCWPPDYPSSHPSRRSEQLRYLHSHSL